MFRERKIEEFLNELSSSNPVPGGGSASALMGCIAASLSSMVFNLTVNKNSFNKLSSNTQRTIIHAIDELNILNMYFLNKADEDSIAFEKVMKAIKLPKDTDEQKSIRKQKLQESYKEAVHAPLQVARYGYEMYNYMYLSCRYGNRNAITDTGTAVLSLQAAIEGAVLNVKINIKYIGDEEFAKDILEECDEYIREGRRKRDEILGEVNKIIEE